MHCDYCLQPIDRIAAFVEHVEAEHANSIGTSGQHICPTCNKNLLYLSAFILHVRIHDNMTCERCAKEICECCPPPPSLDVKPAVLKPYVCRHCNKRFAVPAYLTDRERLHTGHPAFACETFGLRFALKSSLGKHVLRKQKSDRPIVCPVCQRGFAIRSWLVGHMRRHTKKRPHLCKVCEGTFAT